MARLGHPIHAFVLDRVEVPPAGSLLDLGCGSGPALAAASARFPGARLVGVDANPKALAAARVLLDGMGVRAELHETDFDGPLPLPVADRTVDAVICHNVLECLAEPTDLLTEAHRVLRPGAIAVWSHTDFATIVVNTNDGDLGRRVLHAYADQPQPWMRHHDARMGRKLAGLVRASPFELIRVDAHVVSEIEPTPDATDRLDDVARSLVGSSSVDPSDLARWQAEVHRSIEDGSFFFAETSFVVVARAT